MKIGKKLVGAVAAGVLFATAPFVSAEANVKRNICVFDIAGASGDIFNIMNDYKAAALDWGVDISLKAYTDEKIALEDFKGGVCQGVELTGIRARALNKYSGSLAAVGAIPDYDVLHTALKVLSSGAPSVVEKLKTGPNEVAGLVPMGAAYLFVRDRSVNTVNKLSGKKISVMDYDPQQARMASIAGMTPVLSDITNFAGRFNNGSVDISFAPIAAYDALEMYKGLEPNGGIVRFVLGQLLAELVIATDEFPEGFAQKSREWFFAQYDRAMKIIQNADDAVDKKWWMDIPEADAVEYKELLRRSRIIMTEEGLYDPDMTHLLFKVRCSMDSSLGECADNKE